MLNSNVTDVKIETGFYAGLNWNVNVVCVSKFLLYIHAARVHVYRNSRNKMATLFNFPSFEAN